MHDREYNNRIITKDGWIGVDLDGTLAYYDGWKGLKHIGDPIMPMINKVKAWIEAGWDVRIFTARVCACREGLSIAEIVDIIQKWTKKHIGYILPVTNIKDFSMVVCYDDRCIQVKCNTGELIYEE